MSEFESIAALEEFKRVLVDAGVTILPDMKGPVDLYQGAGVDEILTAESRKIRKTDLTAEILREDFIDNGVTAVAPYMVLDMELMYSAPPTSILDPVTFESRPISEEAGLAAVEASKCYIIRAYFRKEVK